VVYILTAVSSTVKQSIIVQNFKKIFHFFKQPLQIL